MAHGSQGCPGQTFLVFPWFSRQQATHRKAHGRLVCYPISLVVLVCGWNFILRQDKHSTNSCWDHHSQGPIEMILLLDLYWVPSMQFTPVTEDLTPSSDLCRRCPFMVCIHTCKPLIHIKYIFLKKKDNQAGEMAHRLRALAACLKSLFIPSNHTMAHNLL